MIVRRRRVIRFDHDAIRIQFVFAEETNNELGEGGRRSTKELLLDIVIDLFVFEKSQRSERLVEIVTGVFQNVRNGAEDEAMNEERDE